MGNGCQVDAVRRGSDEWSNLNVTDDFSIFLTNTENDADIRLRFKNIARGTRTQHTRGLLS